MEERILFIFQSRRKMSRPNVLVKGIIYFSSDFERLFLYTKKLIVEPP